MLSLLHIENIAVIESADIQFDPGFNALTGETGAGKSIVVDSLSAVTGERTSRELIRTGAPSALANRTGSSSWMRGVIWSIWKILEKQEISPKSTGKRTTGCVKLRQKSRLLPWMRGKKPENWMF